MTSIFRVEGYTESGLGGAVMGGVNQCTQMAGTLVEKRRHKH